MCKARATLHRAQKRKKTMNPQQPSIKFVYCNRCGRITPGNYSPSQIQQLVCPQCNTQTMQPLTFKMGAH
jgi:hypothetical protein